MLDAHCIEAVIVLGMRARGFLHPEDNNGGGNNEDDGEFEEND